MNDNFTILFETEIQKGGENHTWKFIHLTR